MSVFLYMNVCMYLCNMFLLSVCRNIRVYDVMHEYFIYSTLSASACSVVSSRCMYTVRGVILYTKLIWTLKSILLYTILYKRHTSSCAQSILCCVHDGVCVRVCIPDTKHTNTYSHTDTRIKHNTLPPTNHRANRVTCSKQTTRGCPAYYLQNTHPHQCMYYICILIIYYL